MSGTMKSFYRIAKKIAGAAAVAAACACLIVAAGCGWTSQGNEKPSNPSSNLIRDVYKNYFTVGAAVQAATLEKYAALLPNFNSVTPEIEMKWSRLENVQGVYTYSSADAIVEWAERNDTAVRGHCLVWYKSLPEWVLADGTTKEEALERIDSHVRQTMEHFGSGVYCWDVVNEALKNTVTPSDVASGNIWRTGNITDKNAGDWYALCGTDYIKQAFLSADGARKEYNLEDVGLYYNDYGLNSPSKREACVQLVQMLQEDGIAIDGVGMQGHYRLSSYLQNPEEFLQEFEQSIKTFTGLGVDVQVTELDIRVYASDNDPQSFDSLPMTVEEQQAEMYAGIFEILRRYTVPWKDGAGCVTNVTVWGVADDSKAWDTAAHKEYPLLFGTDHSPKQAYYEIISF